MDPFFKGTGLIWNNVKNGFCKYVNEIYTYNYGSQALFENAGFKIYESTDKGSRYKLDLQE
jgi:hypothetical protein